MISWIQPARFAVGGGGGGAPTLRGAASLATAYSANSGTTSSFTAGGTNPVIIGSIVGREPSSPSPVLSVCRYGGSGGTTLGSPMTSSDRQFFGDTCRAGRYLLVPGPSGTSDIYAAFSSASLGTIIQGLAFENVSGYDSVTVNSGNSTGTSVTADVTVGSISSGDIILAHFCAAFENNEGTDFNNTGITENTILTQPSAGESRTWVGGVWVLRESAGTSCQLRINCTQTNSANLYWDAYAFRLVPA